MRVTSKQLPSTANEAWSSRLTSHSQLESLHDSQVLIPQSNLVALGKLLNTTYRTAVSVQIGEFEDLLVPMLQELLPFDSAWMGQSTITSMGPVLHSSRLFNLPQEYLNDWAKVKRIDPLAQMVTSAPGIPASVCIADSNLHEEFRAFFAKFRIAHAMCAISVDPASKVCTHLSLYRNSLASPFSTDQMDFHEAIMPNIVSAIAINRIRHINNAHICTGIRSSGIALTSSIGVIMHTDPIFGDFMLLEWPDWDGAYLPKALGVPPGPGVKASYSGKRISVDMEGMDDQVMVVAKFRTKKDLLSPRESAVTVLYGEGNTYKEVAKRLGISPTTVRHHLRQAYSKLGIQDKAEITNVLSEVD